MRPEDERAKAKEYIDRLRDEYVQNHIRQQEREELIAENNIEKRDIRGYHGREILELLQNADDAYQKSIDMGEAPECQLKAAVCCRNNLLTVTNTGTVFDEAGIRAIVQGNNSPKIGKYIGNKGTGFRSVLNWAERVRIFSGNYKVEFSREIADCILKDISQEPQIKKQIEKQRRKGLDLYIPMLAVPENIEDDSREDDTAIEVLLDPQKQNDGFSVLEQVENIDVRILLFLPNTSQIDITTEDKHIVYKREIDSDAPGKVCLKKTVDGSEEIKESFQLFQKTIKDAVEEDGILKDIQLSAAVPEDMEAFQPGSLYSFFPLLDTESPFAAVLHATYALGDHRNTVNVSQANKRIIEEQLQFLTEIASQYMKDRKYDLAYRILIPANFVDRNWKFTLPFAKFGLEEYYLDLLSRQKIFPTVNEELVSIKDRPKMIEGDYPQWFAGESFSRLLQPVQDQHTAMLLKVLARREGYGILYEERELLSAVNGLSDKWNVTQRMDVFLWWNRIFPRSLPCLLKTQDDRWLTFGDECYFLVGGFDAEGVPSWVRIPALGRDCQQELFAKAEKTQEVMQARERDKEPQISRIICQNNLFPAVRFKYRDRSNIISTVNASVDTYDKAIEFVKWLWRNYGGEEQWNPPGHSGAAGVKYKFPCSRDRGVGDSDRLYFGADYGNLLAEKLFDDRYGPFPPLPAFGVEREDERRFRDFVGRFGVRTYPEIEVQEISPLDSYASAYEREIRQSGDLGYSSAVYCEYHLPYIKNLEDLLLKLSTLEAVEWIAGDSALYNCLCSPFCAEGTISYIGNLQHYYRRYDGRIKNYILEVFNEVKWIELDKKRYSPRQILRSTQFKGSQRFKGLVPLIDIEKLEEMAGQLNEKCEMIRDIFQRFDLRDNVAQLGSEEFYGLMLRLPAVEFPRSADLSKAVYRIIEKPGFMVKFEESDNKKRFFEQGKMLVKYQGQLQYFSAKDSYLPSAKIVHKKAVPIVEKGQRTNNEIFVRVFGCREYNSEYSVQEGSIVRSGADDGFQKYFQEFQKYACAYGENNDNIQQHAGRLRVTLVQEISILENGKLAPVEEEYMYIRDKATNWYITVFGTGFNVDAVSEVIENIYANIANTSGFDAGKLGELFRTGEKRRREFLIKKEFGSLDVIADACYQSEIRNNFIQTARAIAPSKELCKATLDSIDFNDFANTRNAPYIIAALKEMDTDIPPFREAGFVYGIDLMPYYRRELRDFIQREEPRYRDFKFTCAKADAGLQDTFMDEVNRFARFEIPEDVNSVCFDFEERVTAEFGEWRTGEAVLSAREAYDENYEKMNPKGRYGEAIAMDGKAQCMIYFGRVEAFQDWLKNQEKQEQEEQKAKESADPYLPYRHIVPAAGEISYGKKADGAADTNEAGRTSSYPHLGAYTHTAAEKRSRNQKVFGNKGELLVYNLLCERVGRENVIARSEAFAELGIINYGQARSGEYDISYIDQGTEYFVEVKTSNENSFFISPEELKYAQEHAEKYRLFLVYDVDTVQPKCAELPERFWENPKFRKKEIIEKIKFEF